MKAVNDFIVIKKIKESIRKTKGGIMINDVVSNDNRYLRGSVVSVGNLVEGINVGNVIHFDRHNGEKNNIEYKGERFNIVRMRDVVLVKEDEDNT